MPFYAVYQHLAIGRGRSDYYLWCNLGQIVLQISSILLCFYCFSQSIITVVAVYSIILVAWLVVWQLVASHLIGLTWKETLMDTLPFLLITALVIATAYFLTTWITNNWLSLIAKVVISVVLYVLLMKVLHVKIFDECLEFAKQKFSRH